MKLTTLKPRLQVVKPKVKVEQVNGSWRDGKSSTQRGYGYQWQQYRIRFLFAHPLCVYCEREGRTTAATVVDHIQPHQGNQALFWNPENHQGLCARCHSSAKQREEKASH